MSKIEPVLLERIATPLAEGAVAVVTLNRPESSNALDRAAVRRFETILDELEREPRPVVLLLTAAGPRAFCAGGDLEWFAALQTEDEVREMSERVTRLCERLHRGKAFVVAAIDGAAVGGGCELLTACHYRIAGPGASFRFVHADRGLPPGWGGLSRLVRQVGRARALELLLSARRLSAEEALDVRLVEELVSEASARDRALELAELWSRRGDLVAKLLELTREGSSPERETAAFVEAWR